MRKTILLLTFVALSLFAFTIPALAAPTHKAIFVVGQSNYIVDGQTMQMDAQTFIENNRTYVPVRYLALALGVAEKDITWQSPNVTLKLADTELKLAEGSKTLTVNGQQIQMDVVVLNKKGRTYLPARWVAEAFGYAVKWQPETQTVLIGPPEKPEEIQNAPFPVKLIKLEMEVGSKKAVGTRPDGSKVDVVLDAAPFLAVESKEAAKWYLEKAAGRELFKKYPPEIIPGTNGHMYLPFASVAKAFGVPQSNIRWDGKTLRMYWNKDVWVEFKPNSNNAVWFDGVKKKLEAPARVKNGVMMVDGSNNQWIILSADPMINDIMLPLLNAMPQTGSDGITTGKPYITCSVCDWSR